MQVRQSLFAGVIHYDLLHWQKNCCDYLFDALAGVMSRDMTLECDANTCRLPMFRQPDGRFIRRFKVVCANTYLTTARRVTLTFVWVHALGTKALMLPTPCRVPALVALCHLQIIILTCHGRRSYSYGEWRRLLIDSAFVFFNALEFLLQYKDDNDTSANARAFTPLARYALYSHIYIHFLNALIYEQSHMTTHI